VREEPLKARQKLSALVLATMGPEAPLLEHFCATLTSDNVSAIMSYVMWREECFWNICVHETYTFPMLVISLMEIRFSF
jgi:hypothetical protein